MQHDARKQLHDQPLPRSHWSRPLQDLPDLFAEPGMNGRDGSTKTRPLRRVLILADESANWKVAGLTQLDRLALTLQEFAEADALPRRLEVCVYWKSDIAPHGRRLPGDPRLRYLELNDKAEAFLREDD